MSKISKLWKDPRSILRKILATGNFKWLPDKPYLELMYYAHIGKTLDLKNPKTFSEKLQWLKLNDRKPEYVGMVDKYEAKKYVSQRIGEEFVIPTLGVWEHAEDIDFEALPSQFVLKCTHDSGGILVCRDKSKLDIKKTRKKMDDSLKREYFFWGREWPYKNVKPRIIAEPYMQEHTSDSREQEENVLTDYKFFCFNGVPKVMYIAKERSSKPEIDFFDMDFKHLPLRTDDDRNAPVVPSKPQYFERMKEISAVLSQNIPHLRVDFYCIGDKLYVGELTFFHGSGMCRIYPEGWDTKLGDWIRLPEDHAEASPSITT